MPSGTWSAVFAMMISIVPSVSVEFIVLISEVELLRGYVRNPSASAKRKKKRREAEDSRKEERKKVNAYVQSATPQ